MGDLKKTENSVAQEGRRRRLIEEWLPMAALGEESIRERRSMTALPPTYYLHVWWARRPLVASRAAIMGALLPAGADHEKFMHMLGIHGDPVAAKVRIAQATRDDVRLGAEAYGYKRAFSYAPSAEEERWLSDAACSKGSPTVLDPTAGGGSIPFEAMRIGCSTIANDLNPVAWLILKATVEFPTRLGEAVLKRYRELGQVFGSRCVDKLRRFYPDEPDDSWTPDGYLWARTIRCPYCNGIIPLSPNWRLDNKGTGVKLVPVTDDPDKRHVRFEIVDATKEQSPGTIKGGDAVCSFADCGRVIDGNEVKAQAHGGRMGEQLYAIVYKEEKVVGQTKTGKAKTKNVRGFRAPRPEDDVREQVAAALAEKMHEWRARGIVPDEEFPDNTNDDRPRQYGMPLWRNLFSPRQLYGHCVSVEVFRELVDELGGPEKICDLDIAALTYLAIAIDKMVSYNGILCRWDIVRVAIRGKFDRHDFAFLWSYAEMAPVVTGVGYDWATKQTGKALKELIDLAAGAANPSATGLFLQQKAASVDVTNQSADNLPGIADGSVDAVVIDPPYYGNVMYAELADYFYVWLKRTAGLLFPEQFSSYLTDKDHEAVANPAKFRDFTNVRGTGGANKRAARDYRERMQAIFAECRRVLKPDGIMVLMFTHKASGAWDALAKGLVEAGFVITASWPVNTEAEGSLHIKDKNAAKSTIFLVCRPRGSDVKSEITYWEDVEPKVAEVVTSHVEEFQRAGVRGVDLYLACFGPALEVFSKHWPMQRGLAVQRPTPPRGAQLKLIEDEEWDAYAVRPEDALMAARKAVKEWRLDQLATVKRHAQLDQITEFFILAWDAFESPQFPADEALKLSRVVGVSFDEHLRGRILELKGGDVILWDSATRAQKGALGSLTSGCILDVLHQAARTSREQNTGVARDRLQNAGLLEDQTLMLALEQVLNVLPSPAVAETSKVAALAGAAADCRALEQLRQVAFSETVPPPRFVQLELPG